MQIEEFFKRVSGRAGLHSREEAQKATVAVFVALRSRIQHETGDNIAAQLPTGMKEMWEHGMLEHLKRAIAGEEKTDLGGFLAKVGQQFGLSDVRDAETVTCAVFTTLRESITPGAQDKVTHSLPEDIREFWLSCTPMEMPGEKMPEGVTHRTGAPTDIEEPGGEVQVVTAPVLFESPKEEVTRPDMPNLDLPTGYNVDMREAENEAQAREVREEMPGAAGPREEHKVMPPAEDRIEMVAPPGEHAGTQGPGSDQYYRADAEMTEEIEEMLRESAEIEAEKVDVYVQAGNVTLRGFVKSTKEREVASDLAARALGVGEIRNELCVGEEHKHGGEHTE